MLATASGFFEPAHIPQDVITGIVTTFIGLALLFCVKPSLDIRFPKAEKSPRRGGIRFTRTRPAVDIRPSGPTSSTEPVGTAAFVVTNRGVMQVVEVEARLFKVDVSVDPPTREPVKLRTPGLFQLSGRATPAKRRSVVHGAKGEFRFITKGPLDPVGFKRWPRPPGESAVPGELRCEYLLFQVRAKHGFTNFGRTAIGRWVVRDGEFELWPAEQDPFQGDRERFAKQLSESGPSPAPQPPAPGPPAPQPPAPGPPVAVMIAAVVSASLSAVVIWTLIGRALIALQRFIAGRTRTRARARGPRRSGG